LECAFQSGIGEKELFAPLKLLWKF